MQNGAELLGLLAKLRKAYKNIVISVCLSVRMEQLGYHWKDFYGTLYVRVFKITCQ